MKVNILCIGDVVGRPGRHILSQKLCKLVKERDIDCVIVNAENAAGGSGLTAQIYDKLLKYGAHLVTLGDHTYRKKEIIPTLESNDNIVRPANLSEGCSSNGVKNAAHVSRSKLKSPSVAAVKMLRVAFAIVLLFLSVDAKILRGSDSQALPLVCGFIVIDSDRV